MINKNTTYQIHISGYNPETQSLLCSFSAEGITQYKAKEYESLNFQVDTMGSQSVQDTIKQICKAAPAIVKDIHKREQFPLSQESEKKFQDVVGHDYEYTDEDLFPLAYIEKNAPPSEEEPWRAEVGPVEVVGQKESQKI